MSDDEIKKTDDVQTYVGTPDPLPGHPAHDAEKGTVEPHRGAIIIDGPSGCPGLASLLTSSQQRRGCGASFSQTATHGHDCSRGGHWNRCEIDMLSLSTAKHTSPGLFIGSGAALVKGGPVGVWLGYIFMSSMVYSMMVALGEMGALYPVSGSFTHYAARWVDPAVGFALGINYWYSYAVTIPTETVAAAIVISYWDVGAHPTSSLTINRPTQTPPFTSPCSPCSFGSSISGGHERTEKRNSGSHPSKSSPSSV